ncbi:hypothetical protein [Flavisericum labens]|uniref:hypothetical protein n=1 Tax=Flavisericum labens TaxID=3377112 RepID=UPI00387AE2F4
MNDLKKHIIFRAFALFVVAILMLPASVKVIHIFEHHEHKVCNGDSSTHFHQVDLDCEFQKFQLNHNFNLPDQHIEIFSCQEISLKSVSQYFFISEYQRLPFSLRGPPALI